MKKSIIIILSLLLCVVTQAQVSKTITGLTAGGLYSGLTAAELSTVTNLTLTGTIDARDFKIMRDSMPVLSVVDLSGTTVAAYKGTDGTISTADTTYIANAIPEFAFCSTAVIYIGKKTLTSFVFPSSITVVGADAFGDCTGLAGVLTIPSTVDSIGTYAFYNCTGLNTVNILSSLKNISEGCFENCSGLTGVFIIPSGVVSIGVEAFLGCTNITYVFIPSSVISIGNSAFYNCSSLKTISIPSSVTSIFARAFNSCSSLLSINVAWTSPIPILNIFSGMDKTVSTLYVLAGTKDAYEAASYWTDFTHIIEGTGFWLSNTTLSVAATANSTASSAVYSNTAWTVSSDATWLNLNQTSGSVNDTLIFTANENMGSSERTATVTVSATGVTDQTITVTQAAGTAAAVDLEKKQAFAIYPNPVKNNFQVTGIDGTATLTLSDLNGRLLLTKEITNAESVSVSSLPKGLYVIKLRDSNVTVQQKLIKE